jgi:hypothetical protein
MKKTMLLLLTGCIYSFGFGQVNIIPEPVSVTVQEGYFQLRSNTAVVVEGAGCGKVLHGNVGYAYGLSSFGKKG